MAPQDQRTHYDVLGISRDADAAAVRSAWKLHVQAWHPDRFSDELRGEAERQTTRINEAYSTLRDSSRRAAYDCRLAADEGAARPEPVRRAKSTPSVPHRAPAAPVGSPMAATAAPPDTLAEQVAAIGRDALRLVRRHPRIFAAAATVWLVVFGGSVVLHAATGPSLPQPSAAPVASSIVTDDAQAEDLEELAERARAEAAEADVELEQLMAEDARRAAAEQAAAEREARIAAAAAAATAAAQERRAKDRNGKPAAGTAAPAPRTTPDGRRIVTILPAA